MIELTTTSAASCRRVAALLAASLEPPVVLALLGPLGAGKTTFVQGLVAALPGGRDLRVQSPTFALARTYETTPPVHHMDLYRLDDEEAARDLGLLEMASDERAFTCVEWPERAPSILAAPRVLLVRFAANASRRRKLVLDGPLADALHDVTAALRQAARSLARE